MIHTAKQLKDKVKNMSGGNGEVAQALIRTYFMERFLERVSVSEYRNNFILKGGMLVASIVGVDMRATMDIDTTGGVGLFEQSITDVFFISKNLVDGAGPPFCFASAGEDAVCFQTFCNPVHRVKALS